MFWQHAIEGTLILLGVVGMPFALIYVMDWIGN